MLRKVILAIGLCAAFPLFGIEMPIATSKDGKSLIVLDCDKLVDEWGWYGRARAEQKNGCIHFVIRPPDDVFATHRQTLIVFAYPQMSHVVQETERDHFNKIFHQISGKQDIWVEEVECKGGKVIFEMGDANSSGIHCMILGKNEFHTFSLEREWAARLTPEEKSDWVKIMRSAKLFRRVSGEGNIEDVLCMRDDLCENYIILNPALEKSKWKAFDLRHPHTGIMYIPIQSEQVSPEQDATELVTMRYQFDFSKRSVIDFVILDEKENKKVLGETPLSEMYWELPNGRAHAIRMGDGGVLLELLSNEYSVRRYIPCSTGTFSIEYLTKSVPDEEYRNAWKRAIEDAHLYKRDQLTGINY